ncbi:hypothetical protein SLA2020_048080 [Shorea laevis]
MDGYFVWNKHREIIHRKQCCPQVGESSSAAAIAAMNNVLDVDQLRDMLHNAIGLDFFNNEKSISIAEHATQFNSSFKDTSSGDESIFEEPKGDAKELM